jgi:hypothetical protein
MASSSEENKSTKAVRRVPKWGLALALAASAFTSAARADSIEPAAQRLFEEGRMLMANGDYEQACAKLAASHKLDPAGGTLMNLGYCYERTGKAASAWVAYKGASDDAQKRGNDERRALATERIAALEPQLCWLTIQVSGLPPSEIRVDGVVVDRAAAGSPLPMDPGEHSIEAASTGAPKWTKSVVFGPAQRAATIEIPSLSAPVAPFAETPAPPARPLRTTAFVLGGVGVAALVAGGYFGLRAKSLWNERNEHCSPRGCDGVGVADAADAKADVIIATSGVTLGLLEIAAASYLLFRDEEPKKRGVSLGIGVTGTRLVVRGAF